MLRMGLMQVRSVQVYEIFRKREGVATEYHEIPSCKLPHTRLSLCQARPHHSTPVAT